MHLIDKTLRTAVAQNLPSNMADLATVVKHTLCMQPLYCTFAEIAPHTFYPLYGISISFHILKFGNPHCMACQGDPYELKKFTA